MRSLKGKSVHQAVILAVVVLFLLAELSLAADFSAEIFYWDPDNDLTSQAGRFVDFTEILGLSDDSVPGLRLRWIYRSGTHMTLDYFSTDNSGTKRITGEIEWEDQIYPIDSVLTGTFKLDQFGIDWEFPLKEYDLNNRKGRIFWLTGIRGYQIKASLQEVGELDTRREFKDTLIGIPVIGFGFDWPFARKWNFNLYFSGVSIEDYGYIYDGKAVLAYHISDRSYISMGYRNVAIKAKEDEDFARTDLKGLYASIGYNF